MSERDVKVKVWREQYGRVVVGTSPYQGTVVADEVRAALVVERTVQAVRDRTPDDWWLRAAEIMGAEWTCSIGWSDQLFDMLSTEGPIGVLDLDWAAIEMDCYEGWREAGFASLADQMRPFALVAGCFPAPSSSAATTRTPTP